MSDKTGKTTIMEQLDVEGLLLSELAELLEVSISSIHGWLTTGRISPKSMEALCKLFDLDESEWEGLTVTRNSNSKGKTWTRTTVTHETWTMSDEGKERISRGQRIRYDRVSQNELEQNT